MQKKNFFVVPTLCILLLVSCAKEGPTGPTGPAGPVLYGDISGYVRLYDKYGSRVLTGLGSVFISLNSASALGIAINPNGTTGNYSFIGVGTGAYYINATDSGYAPTTINNINFVQGLDLDIKLSAIPDSFLTGFTASHTTGAANDSLVLTVTADTRVRNCIVFAYSAATVSNNPSYYLLSYKVAIPANTNTVALAVPGQDLTNAGFASGGTVYYAAYSYVVNDASVYEDLTTGNNVYNAVNGGIAASAIVP